MDGLNSFIEVINQKRGLTGDNKVRIKNYQDVIDKFYNPYPDFPTDTNGNEIEEYEAIYQFVNNSYYVNETAFSNRNYNYTPADDRHFVVRTCNAYWNAQVPIRDTNVHPFYLGMASQRVEREDTIITPDLRGKVFGPLDFSRRDLMAINMQRARDHGLPDFNSARMAYGLPPVLSFEDLNPLYGMVDDVTRSIENLREVYNNDISKCDIWACALAETVPSGFTNLLPPDIPAGPGELFSEVLFDQFMRIRHGDRFWYENWEANGILAQEEFELISSLNMKRLLILVTPITDEDLSESPFQFTNETVCPQPFQLSELYMDDCTDLEGFDYYYNDSVWQVPVIWGISFLYVGLVIMAMFLLAAYNQYRREKVKAAGRTRRPKHIEGIDVTSGDGEVLVAHELKAGIKSETRTVSMKFGPGKRVVLFSGDEIYREVDLRYQSQVTIRRPFNDDRNFVVRIPHEYDIILRCYTPLDRTAFIENIQTFMGENGITVVVEEPLKKQLLSETYTKRDRQRLLENFFKSVFREGGRGAVAGDIGESRKDILECELNKEEFADAMSLKKDSLFVEQMFQLIDQDGNGFISFREFLDMIVIFAKGSPDDKIKLMFEMYDIDKSGQLSRDEFKKMLKAMMELVNASVSPDQMDGLIESMFLSAGFQNKQELTLDDFNVLLRDHKEQLSSAHLNISGVDVDIPEKPGASEGEGASDVVPTRYRARETATARARRTVIKAYGRTTKGDPRGATTSAPAEEGTGTLSREIPIQSRKLTKSVYGRYLSIFLRIVENYKLHIFWLSIFFFVTVCIFVERSYYYSVEREHAGLRRIAGYGVTVTRGAASAMMWTYSVLLLTMSRNFITYLRETMFNNYIPFDSYISFHKIVALTALAFTICHGIGHGINFYHISTQTPGDLNCIFREVYRRTHLLPQFAYWLFLTMTGFSAFILTLVTVIIFVFATQYARRHTFQAFWITHHFYIAFYILMFLHGSGRLVQDPLFGNFFLGPGIVYSLDLIVSVSRRKQELAVIRADILPSLVVGIYFKRPTSFDYKPGQWVKIASSAQNPGEFHSFTISSAPHEDYLSLHIRAVGPWTYNFREHYNPVNLQGKPYPKVFIDGPFGEGHQDWTSYEVSVLVGGGIGVTPFSSILKELVHRFNIGARVECKKVFFIWVTRSQKQWEWFTEIIKDVEDADTKGLVENHIFITQFFDKFDLRTTMLYICEKHFQKLSGRSLFTGLRAITHFGRPDFNQFFDGLQEEYVLLPQIGVFSCGPPGMTNGVEAACAVTNRFEGPAFLHHFENF
jgi:dual oxidase